MLLNLCKHVPVVAKRKRFNLQINPNTAYAVSARAWVDDGYGLAGVTFFTGAGMKLAAAGMRVSATASGAVTRSVFVAPPGAYFAALWAGKWTGGGQLQVWPFLL